MTVPPNASAPTSQVDEVRRSTDPYRLIEGRRWRRSDPALDETTRQHLVDELMDARRAVKSALASGINAELKVARSRVNDAKVALGERGPKWWIALSTEEREHRCDCAVRALGVRTGKRLSRDDAADVLRVTGEVFPPGVSPRPS